MDIRNLERRTVGGSRFLTIAAVVGSLAGSVLMFALGLMNIYAAFRYGLADWARPEEVFGTRAVISVIEGLDRFLIAIVLLYFSYGVYSLFIHPQESQEELAVPAWLRVTQIGQLKQVVAELIVVILFVLFLRQALLEFSSPGNSFTWTQLASLLILPLSTFLLALALKLVQLHPKRPRLDRSNIPAETEEGQGK